MNCDNGMNPNFTASTKTDRSRHQGILLIDKPSGLTSHDIVAAIRKRSGIRKVGHAGTLDPMATGLLLLLLGSYTKRSLFFSGFDKEYEAVIRLGIATDTGDREGTVIAQREIDGVSLSEDFMTRCISSFRGTLQQVPPMYSAKKIGGKKLYQYARKGMAVEREPRMVTIQKMEIADIALPYIRILVACSKGTYIRQLAHDIGEKIGCGAHLASLRRTGIGPFSIQDAIPFNSLFVVTGESPDRRKFSYEHIMRFE